MSIYFRQAAASADAISTTEAVRNMVPLAQQPHSSIKNEHPAPAPDEGERVVTIDMKNIHSDTILSEFLAKTGATVIHPSPDEKSEMRQIQERTEHAAVDRAIVKKFIDDKRRAERTLALAREEAEAIRAANHSTTPAMLGDAADLVAIFFLAWVRGLWSFEPEEGRTDEAGE
ncbi:hypothetical protein F5Y14DRAFT_454046 [Nemania sp. NC0429]|nr:hypothetical protein F5Y14DRAFT_454046 [Nemania sp. NC0429]